MTEEEYRFACELQLHPGSNKFHESNKDEIIASGSFSTTDFQIHNMIAQSMKLHIVTDMEIKSRECSVTDNEKFTSDDIQDTQPPSPPPSPPNQFRTPQFSQAQFPTQKFPTSQVSQPQFPTPPPSEEFTTPPPISYPTKRNVNFSYSKRKKTSKDIALAEFVVLELLRLKRVSLDEIEEMKLIFGKLIYFL